VNTPSSRPLNGSIVASIARRYSVSASSSPATNAPTIALGQAAVALALLVGVGRLGLRPLFQLVARTRSPRDGEQHRRDGEVLKQQHREARPAGRRVEALLLGQHRSWERLRILRRLVFGLGSLQVAVSGLLVGGVLMALEVPPTAAILVGSPSLRPSTAMANSTGATARS
jgi:Kef-type K+ transport system membrane component KefB